MGIYKTWTLDSGLDHGLTTIQALINLFTIIIILPSWQFTLILDTGCATFEQQYLRYAPREKFSWS